MSTQKWILSHLSVIFLITTLSVLACSGQTKNPTANEEEAVIPTSVDSSYVSGDFDGDGLRDLCYVDRESGKWLVFLAKDSDADFDGDGICDAYHYNASTGRWAIAYAVPHTVVSFNPTEYSWLHENNPSGTWKSWWGPGK